MAFVNEQRNRYSKVWDDDVNGGQYITASVVPLHHESVIDSGNYDTENDFTLNRMNNAQLNGWMMNNNGFHVALQGFPETGNQPPQGTLAFGGRKGQHWIGLRPDAIGYLRWPTRTFTNISGAPDFNAANLSRTNNLIPFAETGPDITLNRGFTGSWANLWTTPGGGAVDWVFSSNSLVLKQDIILNQEARDFAASQYPGGPLTQTWFGLRYALEWRDIPRAIADSVLENITDGDFEGQYIELQDTQLRRLGIILPGTMYVRNRGGRVPVRKRLYFDGTDWFLFIGGRADQVNALQPGALVIDPPIAEEDITQNSDDAHERGNGTVSLNGFSNVIYLGDYSAGDYQNLQGGFRFQSIPIDQGTTMTSASITLYRLSLSGTPELRVHCQDADNAGTFTTTGSDLSNRAVTTGALWDTTTTPNLGTGNNQDITSTDIGADVETVVGRVGWSNNNAIVVLVRDVNTAGNDFLTIEDFNAAGTNEARFNATTAAGGGGTILPMMMHL